jgi:putative transposase
MTNSATPPLGARSISFPSDDAATKLLYLVLNHAAAEWKRPPREWAEAKTQFAVVFKERFVRA